MRCILKIGHSIIGQHTACERVFDLIFTYKSVKKPKSEPLLIAFAGPAGHGKTKLAEQLGDMTSSSTTSVNCAELRSSWGLSGSEAEYNGHQDGTSLNNFLVVNDGEYSMVFLDEFDKTHSSVVEALLTICVTIPYRTMLYYYRPE
jgi:ATP-dependent Clp protease ATP-binding subunit ClpA